jgi:choline dehydrogenase-like flavoprotein
VAEQLKAKGLHPFHAPLALNRDTSAAIGEGGDRPCIRCQTCDPYPCKLHAKQDAEIAAVRPALEHANVELAIGAKVRRLVASDDGRRVEAVEVEMDGATQRLTADRVVLSCGAVNSAVIMHASKCDAWPNGAGNSNDLVGRFLTKHNHSALLSIDTSKPNDTVFQKTLGFNDYYFGSPDHDYPLGAVQLTGKAPWQRLAHFANAKEGTMPRAMLEFLAGHSIDWWVTSEDLPDRNNRVQAAADGRPRVTYTPNNRGPHRELLKLWQDHLRDIGFEMFWIQTMGLPVVWHQAGTCVFGADPATSVLDLNCRSHEVENLYVVDSSFMPSMGSVNLTLTICANAIRVGDHMLG